MTDIVEWLRLYARQCEDLHAPQNVTIGMREAADEIERLRADTQKAALEYLGQIGQLSDENTRLRAALHCISLGSQNSMTSKQDLGREARVALSHIVDLDDVLLPPKKDSWT